MADKIFELPKPVKIRENLDRKVLRPLMQNFPSLPVALLELVDNAFDEFDGCHGGSHLDIHIELRKNRIMIENVGGKGMGTIELEEWLDWGRHNKENGIREYGQGGKAAMGYLGNAWLIRTKRWDQPCVWGISEDCWADTSSKLKEYEARATKAEPDMEGLGYCRIEIASLNKRNQSVQTVINKLSNVYRKQLEDGKAKITVNGEPVAPLALPLYERFDVATINVKTGLGWWVNGWVGRLKRDAIPRGGPRITGGMRLLRQGRLIIDGEYFGHPDFRSKASLGMLIGECELGRVPVLPNKTDFNRDSDEWYAVQGVMYEVLKPHIEELLRQKDEDRVTFEEKKRLAAVRQTMIKAFELLREELSDTFGVGRGRKPRDTQQNRLDLDKELPVTEEVDKAIIDRRPPQPRTPPSVNAVGRLRRLGSMPPWEMRVLSPEIRSDWGEKGSERCLLINKKYCLYEERNGDELYIAETAALELAKPSEGEKLGLDEYLATVNEIMRVFCEVANSNE